MIYAGRYHGATQPQKSRNKKTASQTMRSRFF